MRLLMDHETISYNKSGKTDCILLMVQDMEDVEVRPSKAFSIVMMDGDESTFSTHNVATQHHWMELLTACSSYAQRPSLRDRVGQKRWSRTEGKR